MDFRVSLIKIFLKNEPGEHDQVETHTPIMYRGNVDAEGDEPYDTKAIY